MVRDVTGKELTMKTLFNRFVRDESGATAIEYGLIAALIAVAIIVVLGTVVLVRLSPPATPTIICGP